MEYLILTLAAFFIPFIVVSLAYCISMLRIPKKTSIFDSNTLNRIENLENKVADMQRELWRLQGAIDYKEKEK